jgi:peptidoglycan hydrolase-like protein with peptidoglycan-binding domain
MPPRDPSDAAAYTFVTVEEGEVGSSINLNTVAEWTLTPVGSNQASGTVTSVVIEPGQEVGAGAVLYTVNLRPVVIAQGAVPAFQSLAQGMKGADVTQLQTLLTSTGFYSGAVNGTFGSSTTAAVKAWQKSLGIPADGMVQTGDLVFVPTLPTRVALDTKVIKRGAAVSGGEPVVTGLPTEPSFYVPASEAQAALIPDGTVVEISGPDGAEWTGVASGQEADEFQSIRVHLSGVSEASICGDGCASVPVTEASYFSSRVVTVASVTGLRVPSAALLSAAGGTTLVIDDEGVEHEVQVVTSARGMSIIEGVPVGTRVRVPASSGS